MTLRTTMLSTTVIPVAVALGIVGVATMSRTPPVAAQTNPCAGKNPCAAKAANPCNPCAAKNPCNPCAAAAGNPCNPCNPCAGAASAYSANCVVPRLQAAVNPCAAKKPCGPCSAKAPCNPCAAKASNPCAAKNPCNPCAAKNPCNPCSAAAAIELTDAEAVAAYDCIIGEMKAAYAKSGLDVAKQYAGWKRYSRVSYASATHGNRFVSNYANAVGGAYGKFEDSGRMPTGTYLVKDSFVVSSDGKVGVGPLFVMRKMETGWHAPSGDWKYAMAMPNGAFFGETNGRNAANMVFCHTCHMVVAEGQDSMYFMPEDFRAD